MNMSEALISLSWSCLRILIGFVMAMSEDPYGFCHGIV